ncbi:reverse transcriptase domain-containing protein [Synoicihabitans lomoniglobus]|uniref:Reverse transcriptase domain-containing protein n=1 Tax=Synoicihabitans lomoniglobus TaxID=2909285 RepID=A0AAF0CQ68_9BACT|nr:hypothetical protein [Opitutaceae bacterium LMO-M01]WED66021.1 reverse transcriptase domain-containing protein [Opitutaceae bacterium LMO-M01]
MIHDSDKLVRVAYKKLKQMVYYDKTFLFLRKRLAEFECGEDFLDRLEQVESVLKVDAPFSSELFRKWLDGVGFVFAPKSLRPKRKPDDDEGSFVSNVTSERNYPIEKVNYLFDGPIELHLIAVLWLMTNGFKLDALLVENCYGSRLDNLVGNEDDHSANLFQKYHERYAKWRDDGINKAADLLTRENRSACIIALDLQEFYYRVQLDWDELWNSIRMKKDIHSSMRWVYSREILGENLLGCVKAIGDAYQLQIAPFLNGTHTELPPESTCLPIGLCSSPVIANWYLRDFDRAILSEVRPAYYGRYVDDILIVVANDTEPGQHPVTRFMDDVLVRTGVMHLNNHSGRYEVVSSKGLFLQKRKCVLQFFEAGHSFAGLEKFRKELQENASDFAMLPVDGDESPVEQVAYDLLYDGSINKLRSVKGIAENRWELAKHLAKQTQLQLLAAEGLDANTKRELFMFFKGRNALEYWDMWERVFAFLIAAGNLEDAERLRGQIEGELRRLRYVADDEASNEVHGGKITRLLKQSLRDHLQVSYEICRALRAEFFPSLETRLWRDSNLIRHHLVAVPLLNYTDYAGDYIVPDETRAHPVSRQKIEWSPRFVHFEECVGLIDSWFVDDEGEDSITAANSLYARFHGKELDGVSSLLIKGEEDGPQ